MIKPILILIFLAANPALAEENLKLPVTYHHQEHGLSCEAAALKIVLDDYGVKISEEDILKKMPFDHTPHANGIWGDPDLAFVGDLDGEMGVTGYGIHWKALQVLAQNWKKTDLIESGKLTDLTHHLTKGRPVIIWGYKGSRDVLIWKTKSGRQVRGLLGEHTRVVYGFRGKPDAPEGFYIMDPDEGPFYWTSEQLAENWNTFSRCGLVLYK